MTDYRKEDDYTLRATTELPEKGFLHRYFNFAAEEVRTILTVERSININRRYSGSTEPVAAAVALTSQMDSQKFSDFDSMTEVELMREKLISLGGKPPELSGRIRKEKSIL